MAILRFSYEKDKNIMLTPHFAVWEFRSFNEDTQTLTTDTILIDERLPQILEKLYNYCEQKYGGLSQIKITSGYRDQAFENYLGGYQNGPHVRGIAADIITFKTDGSLIPGSEMCLNAQDIGVTGIGYIGNAIHVDVRDEKLYFDETQNERIVDDWYTYFNVPKEEDPEIIEIPNDCSIVENENNVLKEENERLNLELQGYKKIYECNKTGDYIIKLYDDEVLFIKKKD